MWRNKEKNDLRCRKINDLAQYGRCECLYFDGFEASDAESAQDSKKFVKNYINNKSDGELNDHDYYRIYRIGLKKEKNGNKYQQILRSKFTEHENATPRYV